MAYVKNTWVTGDIATTRKLNALETQYDAAKVYIDANLRKGTALPLIVENAASAPTATAARLYFDTVTLKFYVANGTSFAAVSGVV